MNPQYIQWTILTLLYVALWNTPLVWKGYSYLFAHLAAHHSIISKKSPFYHFFHTCFLLCFMLLTIDTNWFNQKPIQKNLCTTATQKDWVFVLQDQLSLNAGQSIAECSKGSILQYFWPSLSCHLSLRSLFWLFWVAILLRFYCSIHISQFILLDRLVHSI